MLYEIARIIMTAGLRFFYRHLFVSGFERIPQNGPLIIIANHHASLMDAALIGLLLPRQAWFYARGDVFKNRFITWLLRQLHMLPVHSHQAGKSSLALNNDSFAEGKKILGKGGILVFFPESFSHTTRQLLPFRKGIFRLGQEAAEYLHTSIPVVPVGITYDHPVKAGKTVQVSAGTPFLLSQSNPVFRDNPNAVLLRLSREARQSVFPLVLHIDKKERLGSAEKLLEMLRNGQRPLPAHPWTIHDASRLAAEQGICRFINNLSEKDYKALELEVDQYVSQLEEAGVKDAAMVQPYSAWKMAVWWMTAPVFLAGVLLNGPPLCLSRRLTGRLVSRKDFFSWIFVVLCTALYPAWLIALSLLAGGLWGTKWAAATAFAVAGTGLLLHYYADFGREQRRLWRWHQLPVGKKTALLEMRKALVVKFFPIV